MGQTKLPDVFQCAPAVSQVPANMNNIVTGCNECLPPRSFSCGCLLSHSIACTSTIHLVTHHHMNLPSYCHPQATTADVVVTTEAVCDLPDMHSIAHDGFDCKFHKYGVQGEMGNMGATIPPGAWPPGDNRVPHIVVSNQV